MALIARNIELGRGELRNQLGMNDRNNYRYNQTYKNLYRV